jgi:hypothetical protein
VFFLIDLFVCLIEHKVMCRQTLSKRLHARYLDGKEKLVAHLMTLKAVCTTADCWSARGKSYVGVTCHWIDPKKLKGISICLAIRRIFLTHIRSAGENFRVHQYVVWN